MPSCAVPRFHHGLVDGDSGNHVAPRGVRFNNMTNRKIKKTPAKTVAGDVARGLKPSALRSQLVHNPTLRAACVPTANRISKSSKSPILITPSGSTQETRNLCASLARIAARAGTIVWTISDYCKLPSRFAAPYTSHDML